MAVPGTSLTVVVDNINTSICLFKTELIASDLSHRLRLASSLEPYFIAQGVLHRSRFEDIS